jgi:hypothetical protein
MVENPFGYAPWVIHKKSWGFPGLSEKYTKSGQVELSFAIETRAYG